MIQYIINIAVRISEAVTGMGGGAAPYLHKKRGARSAARARTRGHNPL